MNTLTNYLVSYHACKREIETTVLAAAATNPGIPLNELLIKIYNRKIVSDFLAGGAGREATVTRVFGNTVSDWAMERLQARSFKLVG